MAFSKALLLDILAEANENQPESRQLSYKAIVSAAYRAELEFESSEELEANLREFASAATRTHSAPASKFIAACVDLLPVGHTLGSASLDDKIEWLLSDPILEESRKPLVAAAINSYASETENSHAWVRLKALADQNVLPKEFINTIAVLEREAFNG